MASVDSSRYARRIQWKAEAFGVSPAMVATADHLTSRALRAGADELLPPHVAPEDAGEVFLRAWLMCSLVDRYAERNLWINYLRRLGYTDNGEHVGPPREVTLYRGCPRGRECGISWTDHVEWATYYAHEAPHTLEPGIVWRARVPASSLLAVIGEPGEAREYVVDVNSNVRPRPMPHQEALLREHRAKFPELARL